MKKEKSTTQSKAFMELKDSRLIRSELPENIHNTLDDCRMLDKLFQSYEVWNFEHFL
jgi:hypothetical protein